MKENKVFESLNIEIHNQYEDMKKLQSERGRIINDGKAIDRSDELNALEDKIAIYESAIDSLNKVLCAFMFG